MSTIKIAMVVVLATTLATACRKREAAELAENLVNFEAASQGISAGETSIVVKVKLVRPTDQDIPVTINLTEVGVAYTNDYTTTPAATAGKLELVIPSGNNEASFTVTKTAGALFDGDEQLLFDIYSSGAPVYIGVIKKLKLDFAELLATTGSLTLNGGGLTYPNKVFVDLSANRQTPVLRTSWDLGFYADASDFRVILNSSSAMMAKQIAKNDLNTVTAADTIGFGAEMTFSGTAPNPATLSYIDYPTGDITRTAIAAVSATAIDNKVYIVNRGTGVGTPAPARGWKKIRVTRNASGGYTLQHADIAATSFTSIDIPKDDAYFFKYISFETGLVSVEPQKKKWDIAWTYFTNTFGTGAAEAPFLYQDFVIQNRNVQVATVMVASKTFDAFAEADLAAQSFSSSQIKIGADWRSTFPAAATKADRYYIIKDGDNNYYKLKFTGMTQNGERGYPAYQAVLVKKG